MVSQGLIEAIEAACHKVGGISRLPQDAADVFVDGLAEAHVVDRETIWWWTSLKVEPTCKLYSDSDGLVHLAELIGERTDVRLVVTDDEAPPWPVYSGDASQILEMIGECHFFELILAAPDYSWLVFDTHHNELVSVGL